MLAVALLAGCGGSGEAAAPASILPPQTAVAPSATAAGGAGPTITPGPPASDAAGPPATSPPLTPYTGDPFFDAGSTPAGEPGDIIRSRSITSPLDGAEVWQILYWSRTAEDRPVAVSATVVAPSAPATSPRPIFAYAHATTGLGDQCAPSAGIEDGTGLELQIFPLLLSQGMTIVETDYQGLGTPGDHPYIIGQSEGRNVLDSIRAASRLEGTGAGPDSKALVWGHSQGGGAAAFTAELQPTYAPDVDLVGAIAGAPPADLTQLRSADTVAPSAYLGFIPMVVSGLLAGYPELGADDAGLSADARDVLTQVDGTCLNDALTAFSSPATADLFKAALDGADWKTAIAANRAGDRATDVPIFIYHGEDDDLVPVDVSARLLDRYCANGVTAFRKVYPGTDHGSVLTAAFGDIAAYVLARLDGEPAPSSCP